MYIFVYLTEHTIDVLEAVKPVYVKLGKTAKLSCKLSKTNISDGMWSLNDTPVQPSDRVVVGFNEEEQHIFIYRVTNADLGMYTYCAGSTSSSAVLRGL